MPSACVAPRTRRALPVQPTRPVASATASPRRTARASRRPTCMHLSKRPPSSLTTPPGGEVALDLTDTQWELVAPLIRLCSGERGAYCSPDSSRVDRAAEAQRL